MGLYEFFDGDKFMDSITLCSIFNIIAGAIFSAIATLILIQIFKPKINIKVPEIQGNTLKIPIINERKCSAATNIRIEAAALFGEKTYHLDFDRFDFIMLSPKTNKTDETPYKRSFLACCVNKQTINMTGWQDNGIRDFYELLLNNPEAYLRVRVHASHGFTGFGKAFEEKFKMKPNGSFEKIKK